MKVGDLVRIKEFYKGFHSPRDWGIIIDTYTDDDLALWYRIGCDSYPTAWHPDYELELLSTNKPSVGEKKDV